MATLKRSYGTSKASNKMPSGRVPKYPGLYIGVVKNNVDAQSMGRLEVWVPEFGSVEHDPNAWRTVGYCSPFAGATPVQANGTDLADYAQTQTTYGMWFVPPDVNAQVIIFFVNGDPARGYWMGCLFDQYMNHMVPGVASSENYRSPDSQFPKGKTVPVGEYNKNTNEKISDNISRPVATPQYDAIASQGLINDPIRGTSTSTARREAPSQVYGISTPGPLEDAADVNNFHRLGGNSFVMDDGTGTEHITIKTRSGSKIRIDETNGMIYFINKTGTGWMQLDQEGNVDIFAAKDMSFRAQQDVNIRADRDLNIEAGRNINMKAAKDYMGAPGEGIATEDSDPASGGDITIQALNNLNLTVEVDSKINNKNNIDIIVGNDGKIEVGNTLYVKAGTNINTETGVDHNHKAGGNINTEATVDQNIKAGGNVNIDSGADLNTLAGANNNMTGTAGANINGGAAVLLTGGEIHLNGPDATEADPAAMADPAQSSTAEAPVTETNEKTNILVGFDDQYKFERSSNQVLTTVGRFITYEPCPEHKE